jgi:lipopolysaccharide export system permease protein
MLYSLLMPRLLDRYVLREVVPPFLVGLLLVVFALLMNQVLLLADLFIDKGVPWAEALRLLALLVPSILVFALPMAVLMGVLGGLARLSADSEIVALRSAGVGPGRLARPLVLFGLAGFLLTLPLALFLAPRANDAWVKAMTDSVLGRVRLKVERFQFNEMFPGLVFRIQDIGPDGSWSEVFAAMTRDPAHPRFVLARSGRIRLYPEERRAVLELVDGTSYAGPLDSPGEDTVTAFDRLEEEIDVAGMFPALTAEKRVREKDIGELIRDVRALRAAAPSPAPPPRQVRAHLVEIHKKFALPAACLILALLGLPLGVMTGRAGRTGGFSLSLVLILLYYALLTAGEQAAMDGRLSAALGIWAPDIVLAAAAALLFLAARRGRALPRLPSFRRGSAAVRSRRPDSAPSPAPSEGRARWSWPLRFPGLLDRYIARKFLGLFGLILAALVLAAFLFTLLETREVMHEGQPNGLVIRYTLAKLPGLLAFLLPVSVLAAALLALGLIARTNEATALKASGVSAYRMIAPVLLLAAAVGLLAFLIQEHVVPAANVRAERLLIEDEDRLARSVLFANRHWVFGPYGRRIYHFDYFEPGTSTFGRLSVFDLDWERWRLLRRTYAETAAFEGDELVFRDGWTRDYAAVSGPAFFRRPEGRIDVTDDPRSFRGEPWQEPQQMSLGELRRYTADVRSLGFPAVRLRAALAEKISLPFVSLVMALLAVPFGFQMGRKGTLVGVGLSVIIAMAYWGVFALFRSLGAAGALTPVMGAWGANALFGLAGVIGLLRLRT